MGVLQAQTKSKCLEQARATQHRHLRLPWAPRAAPKSVRVSFCPATCAAAGRADQLQAQVGAGHAYASTSISTQAPTHLSTPRPDFMEQIHITLREKYSNNICKSTHKELFGGQGYASLYIPTLILTNDFDGLHKYVHIRGRQGLSFHIYPPHVHKHTSSLGCSSKIYFRSIFEIKSDFWYMVS